MRTLAMLVAALCAVLLPSADAQVTRIQHVILIFKENRSFDHMFGTMPGVNGATQGRSVRDVSFPWLILPTVREITLTAGAQ